VTAGVRVKNETNVAVSTSRSDYEITESDTEKSSINILGLLVLNDL